MKRIAGLLVVWLVGLSLAAPPGALGATTLEVIVFPGGFNWPIWAAMEKGFFAREGLEIKLTPTPNSVFQLTNLIGGKFDAQAAQRVRRAQEGADRPRQVLRPHILPAGHAGALTRSSQPFAAPSALAVAGQPQHVLGEVDILTPGPPSP